NERRRRRANRLGRISRIQAREKIKKQISKVPRTLGNEILESSPPPFQLRDCLRIQGSGRNLLDLFVSYIPKRTLAAISAQFVNSKIAVCGENNLRCPR